MASGAADTAAGLHYRSMLTANKVEWEILLSRIHNWPVMSTASYEVDRENEAGEWADVADLPLVVVRKRQYGLEGEVSLSQVTGYSESEMYINDVEEGDRVLVLDDVLSTGGTLSAITGALDEIGAEVVDVVAVIKKEGGENALEETPYEAKTLINIRMDGDEVVIVDDASTDTTADVVARHAREHANVRLVRVEEPRPPRKKHALTRGIGAARHELLAFTDADCAPPPEWLTTLTRHHAAESHDLVLVGYSPYRHRADLLGRLAAYETFVTGFLTAAAAGLGRGYMGVGRNISYPRTVFDRIGGFEHSRQSLSGDDDLLVQEVQRRAAAEVRAVLDPRSFVPTDAPATWRAWLKQKKRHTSAGRFYHRSVQAHLAVFQGLFYYLDAYDDTVWAADTLGERRLLPAFPVLELLYAGYNLVVAPLGLARVPEEW